MRDISDNDVKNKNIKFLPQKPCTMSSAEVLSTHVANKLKKKTVLVQLVRMNT